MVEFLIPCTSDGNDPRTKVLVVGLGAMKSGTSWLSRYLKTLRGFLRSPVKEMNVFNQFVDNPFRGRDAEHRLIKMEKIILGPKPLTDARTLDRLRAFAQIGHIENSAEYLQYFAERMRGHTHFGEFSPSYAYLPAETLLEIAGLTQDVRFLFVMRDPAKRAASHIRHLRRRLREDVSVDTILDEISPVHAVWRKSDYGFTLDRLNEAGLMSQSRILVFETLFQDETIRDLCSWLGLEWRPPPLETFVHRGRGDDLTLAQHEKLRETLDPIYCDLQRRYLPDGSLLWQWR
jgi:hypothetical protein